MRRRVTVAVAGVSAVAVAVGGGQVLVRRHLDASPPETGGAHAVTAEPVARASGPDDGLPWVAWARVDTSAPDTTQVVARIHGGDVVLATVPGQRVDLLGWYGGVDHRTLVWAQTGAHQQQTLYAVPLGADGSATTPPAPLAVPGQPALPAGRAFAVPGAGPALWRDETSPGVTPTGVLVAVSADLGTASREIFDDTDGQAVLVTRDHVAVSTPAGIELENRTAVHGRSIVPACNPPRDVAVSDDGRLSAFVCTDGHVDLLRVEDGRGLVQSLPVVPGSSDERIRAWWDHDDGLHVSTTTAVSTDPDSAPGTTSVDLATDTWVPGEDGVLSRVVTWGAPGVRVASAGRSLASGDVGQVVIESSTEVDLGPTTGSVAVRQTATTPTADPAAHGAVAIPWTARVLHPNPADPGVQDVGVTVDGVERLLGLAELRSALHIVGWTGTARRTLVVARLLDDTDDAYLYRIDLDASGTHAGPPSRLTLRGPNGRHPVSGRGLLTPAGRLVVVQHTGTRSAPNDSTILRFSPDLSTAVSQPLPGPTGDSCAYCTFVRAATADWVLQLGFSGGDGAEPWVLTASGRHGVGSVEIPSCPSTSGDPRVTLSPDGRTAAVTCRHDEVDVVDLRTTARRHGGLTRLRLPSVTTGTITSWWDPSGGLHATTAAVGPGASAAPVMRSDQMTTWDWQPARTGEAGSWSVSSPPLVVNRAYAADGWVARLVPHGTGQIATYDWVSDTDPAVLLDTVTDPAQVLAIR